MQDSRSYVVCLFQARLSAYTVVLTPVVSIVGFGGHDFGIAGLRHKIICPLPKSLMLNVAISWITIPSLERQSFPRVPRKLLHNWCRALDCMDRWRSNVMYIGQGLIPGAVLVRKPEEQT